MQASLCQTAEWIAKVGERVDPDAAAGLGDVARHLERSDTALGELEHLGPLVRMGATPARWTVPTSLPGSSPPAWTDRRIDGA